MAEIRMGTPAEEMDRAYEKYISQTIASLDNGHPALVAGKDLAAIIRGVGKLCAVVRSGGDDLFLVAIN